MKKISVIAIIAILAACLFLSGCGYTLEGGQPDGKVTSNNGIAVQQGDYIYYINGSMPGYLDEALENSPEASIFRMNADGTNPQQLTTRKAYAFYVVKQYIYFLSPITANRLCIFRISINGGNEKRIIEFEANGEYAFSDHGVAAEIEESIILYSFKTEKKTTVKDIGNVAQMFGDEQLYYYVGNRAGVFRIDWEGGEPEQVTERNGRIMAVTQNALYYLKNSGDYAKLTMFNFETEQETSLTASKYDTMLISLKNNIMVAYSSEKTTLYYMLLDGVSTRVALLNENVSTYAIGDDRIFFCSGSENALYSINIDGTDKKKIADVEGLAGPGTTDPNYYLDVVGDKVFMFDSNDGQAVYMIDLVSGEVVNLFDEKN